MRGSSRKRVAGETVWGSSPYSSTADIFVPVLDILKTNKKIRKDELDNLELGWVHGRKKY